MADGLDRCLAEMERGGVDVLLLGRESNARFVSDATRLWLAGTRAFAPTCVVVRETAAVHLLSVTDAGLPRKFPTDRLYPLTWNPMNAVESVANIDGVRSARRIGVDGMTPMFADLLVAALPNVELVDGEALMRSARRVKSERDLVGIRSAIDVAQRAFGAAVGALEPGIRERELVGVFEEEMARLGTSTPAFEGTFCVVDDEGWVRRIASDRVVERGDLVAMHGGVLFDGWEGSFARTWPCGPVTDAHRARWSRWQPRWQVLLDRCRAGARVADVRSGADGVAVYGLGLGYEGLAADAVLEPGMVIALELAADGMLGADTLLISDHAARSLTTYAFPAFAA